MQAASLVGTRWEKIGAASIVVLAILAAMAWAVLRDTPVRYADDYDHFKYGSIGSEPGGSIFAPIGGLLPPAKIFAALPTVCPDRINGGYQDFGLIYEEGHRYPIGVSERRRYGIDFVGVNCAICHTGTYREKPDGPRQVVAGMPANRLELQRLFQFVIACSLDDRFTPDNVVAAIASAVGPLGPVDELLYRNEVIPRSRQTTKAMNDEVERLMSNEVTPWGAGRVDTFNPYKAEQFHWDLRQLPIEQLNGASDYPSLWNQRPRLGMQLHWDGNNRSLNERNLSAALGAGVTPVTVDHASIDRIKHWAFDLRPTAYPFPVDAKLAAQGERVYARGCAECHGDHRFREGVGGANASSFKLLGQVTPLADIGTDAYRWSSYTFQFSENQYSLYPASSSALDLPCDSPEDMPPGGYQFKCFRKTAGYANQPLDGIWLKAPYLHNGSVPTMRDLLESHERRPSRFYRGYDVYDPVKLGFVSNVSADDITVAGGRHLSKAMFLYDTALPGNSNWGHEGPRYGTDLSDGDKDAVVEYMKTF